MHPSRTHTQASLLTESITQVARDGRSASQALRAVYAPLEETYSSQTGKNVKLHQQAADREDDKAWNNIPKHLRDPGNWPDHVQPKQRTLANMKVGASPRDPQTDEAKAKASEARSSRVAAASASASAAASAAASVTAKRAAEYREQWKEAPWKDRKPAPPPSPPTPAVASSTSSAPAAPAAPAAAQPNPQASPSKPSSEALAAASGSNLPAVAGLATVGAGLYAGQHFLRKHLAARQRTVSAQLSLPPGQRFTGFETRDGHLSASWTPRAMVGLGEASGAMTPHQAVAALFEGRLANAHDAVQRRVQSATDSTFGAALSGEKGRLGDRAIAHGYAGAVGGGLLGGAGAILGGVGGGVVGAVQRLRGKKDASILRSAGKGALYVGLGGAALGSAGLGLTSVGAERSHRRKAKESENRRAQDARERAARAASPIDVPSELVQDSFDAHRAVASLFYARVEEGPTLDAILSRQADPDDRGTRTPDPTAPPKGQLGTGKSRRSVPAAKTPFTSLVLHGVDRQGAGTLPVPYSFAAKALADKDHYRSEFRAERRSAGNAEWEQHKALGRAMQAEAGQIRAENIALALRQELAKTKEAHAAEFAGHEGMRQSKAEAEAALAKERAERKEAMLRQVRVDADILRNSEAHRTRAAAAEGEVTKLASDNQVLAAKAGAAASSAKHAKIGLAVAAPAALLAGGMWLRERSKRKAAQDQLQGASLPYEYSAHAQGF